MEYEIKLEKDECDFILNALQYLQNENLKKSLEAIQNTKFEDVKGLYVSEEFWDKDKEYKMDIIYEQIEAIDDIYEKICNQM